MFIVCAMLQKEIKMNQLNNLSKNNYIHPKPVFSSAYSKWSKWYKRTFHKSPRKFTGGAYSSGDFKSKEQLFSGTALGLKNEEHKNQTSMVCIIFIMDDLLDMLFYCNIYTQNHQWETRFSSATSSHSAGFWHTQYCVVFPPASSLPTYFITF